MVSRVAMLIQTALCFEIDFVLEQPLSSLMKFHPRCQALWALSDAGCVKPIKDSGSSMCVLRDFASAGGCNNVTAWKGFLQ
eukprot:880211-Alexandrium_andersonii.AAC.1